MIDVVVHSDLFGAVVVVVADAEGAESIVPTLPEAERALMASWGERRQRTFALGRFALRGAIAELDVDGAIDVGVVGRDDRGAPVLPPSCAGLRCSVSHKDQVGRDGGVVVVAAALVTRDVDTATVGVDVEFDEGQVRARVDKLAEQTLVPAELAQLPDDNDDARRRAVLTRFSLKEALYKALDPHVRRYIGFKEVSVVDDGLGFACDVSGVGAFDASGRVVDVNVSVAVDGADVGVVVTAAHVVARAARG